MMSWAGEMTPSLNMAPAYSIPPSAPFRTSPAETSLEENAMKAQQMLVEYEQQVAQPHRRKDMNIEFPPGLFPPEKEIDLEGSQQVGSIWNCMVTIDLEGSQQVGSIWNCTVTIDLEGSQQVGSIWNCTVTIDLEVSQQVGSIWNCTVNDVQPRLDKVNAVVAQSERGFACGWLRMRRKGRDFGGSYAHAVAPHTRRACQGCEIRIGPAA